MTPNGTADPYQQYNFKVEVDGIQVGGFERASGLTLQMETVEYREGGVNDRVHQFPGQFEHSNLVLRKGLTDRTTLWDWIDDVKAGSTANSEARRTVVLKLQKSYKSSDMWGWEFQGAYPVRWSGPDLEGDKTGGSIAVESLELAHEGFTKLSGSP